MGKSLYEGSPVAKDLYDRAARILPFDLRAVSYTHLTLPTKRIV